MELPAERRFRILLAIGCAFASVLPNLYALIATPHGATYLGVQYNTDDHMVYAAWVNQAMHGHWLFDNRFTTDPQPGLTVHLYFLAVGWLAKVVGIQGASALARCVLTGCLVWTLSGFVARVARGNGFVQRVGPVLAVFGAGAGFLTWHVFGTEIVRPGMGWAKVLSGGRLPTDVWQPEGFAFPSMLTSGLFVAALCLMLVTFQCVLDARESWRPVLPGALAFGALMNIHSYDTLLVAMVLVGFLAMAWARGLATGVWVGRALVIGAGALPAALWFLKVLREDPVFQARAATPTLSPDFRAVLLGYLGLIAFALLGLELGRREGGPDARRMGVGLAILSGLLVAGYALASTHTEGYWMGPAAWVGVFALCIAALVCLSGDDPTWNLVAAWAVLGTAALYFPALFERKLAMGLGIPWAILAALGLAPLLGRTEVGKRQVAGTIAVLGLCASSVGWLARQFAFIRNDVSNTTVHSVYIPDDVEKSIEALRAEGPRRIVALAMPGVPLPRSDAAGDTLPDTFDSPYLADFNPVLSGLAGAYTYAGHWSETPDYEKRRAALTRFFLGATTDAERRRFAGEVGATHILAPIPEAFPMLPLADVSGMGKVVVDGTRFRLVRL